MSHDDAFAAHVARRDAARAARDVGRVTWRKVSPMTGGGWSGIGAGGRLVWVRPTDEEDPALGVGYEIGRIEDGARVRTATLYRATLAEAKREAAGLLASGDAPAP